MSTEEFEAKFGKCDSSDSKFDLCISSLKTASPELQDVIFGKIVNLDHSSLNTGKKYECESLFQQNLSNADPEIRAWIPLGIKRWEFNNLTEQLVELSHNEEDFTVNTCIFRALDGMDVEFVMPDNFQSQVEDYLLNSDYQIEDSLEQKERAVKMLPLMGNRGIATFCRLVFNVELCPRLFSTSYSEIHWLKDSLWDAIWDDELYEKWVFSDFLLSDEFQNQVVDYLLHPNYHSENFLEQRLRAGQMLPFMGYRGVETFCKLVLDIDRSEYILGGPGGGHLNWHTGLSCLWNSSILFLSTVLDYEKVKVKFDSFSDEEKLNIEGYLIEMATIFEGKTSEDMDGDYYHKKYEPGRYDDGWASSYFRHENGEGIYRNGEGVVKIGLRSLGEIGTPSARKFLVDYFNDESRNKIRVKYQADNWPDNRNIHPFELYSFRLCALEALGNRVPYPKIRETVNQFLDDALSNNPNFSGGVALRIGIAKLLSEYGRDPDGLFDILLDDDDTYVRSQTRMYLKLMGGDIDTQRIVDDIRLDDGRNRVANMLQYLELEENPDVDLIRQCITELAYRDDLQELKDFLEDEEIPFKKIDQETVDEWIQLLEGRMLMTDEDPDLVIITNRSEFEEDNA